MRFPLRARENRTPPGPLKDDGVAVAVSVLDHTALDHRGGKPTATLNLRQLGHG